MYADIGHILFALNNLSPWWVIATIGILVAFILWHFFAKILSAAYRVLKLDSCAQQATLLIISTVILFG